MYTRAWRGGSAQVGMRWRLWARGCLVNPVSNSSPNISSPGGNPVCDRAAAARSVGDSAGPPCSIPLQHI
eukprot:scaffold25603_cov107-Isochrysis_galbana.AAC.1